ncbi:MAG: ribonuclease HII [Rhodospirillales bacterium]|nr:ribonuclease HII [Rhodospirillales bacterium]MBO6785245.1 ribonuclease HII [Rhodospirillales bacterium]
MPDLALEQAHWDGAARRVCGIDEAGRGPLAGPVVAAAVVLDPATLDKPIWEMLDDSKRMSAASRDALFKTIMETADVGVGVCDVDEIDLLNILGATMKAMADAVRALEMAPDVALVDGNREPALTCACECVVKGDQTSLSIAAASVIAKVTRDRIMSDLAARHPGYGWERNAGYGTAEHLAAIASLGVTSHHRRSFAPVRDALTHTSD